MGSSADCTEEDARSFKVKVHLLRRTPRKARSEIGSRWQSFSFDAETALAMVGDVFDVVEVQRWDTPTATLPDRAATELFLRGSRPAASRRRDGPQTDSRRRCA